MTRQSQSQEVDDWLNARKLLTPQVDWHAYPIDFVESLRKRISKLESCIKSIRDHRHEENSESLHDICLELWSKNR